MSGLVCALGGARFMIRMIFLCILISGLIYIFLSSSVPHIVIAYIRCGYMCWSYSFFIMLVGRYFAAYLRLCMIGYNFFIMRLIVRLCLRSSCTMIPSSFACVFCSRVVVLTVSVMFCCGCLRYGKNML